MAIEKKVMVGRTARSALRPGMTVLADQGIEIVAIGKKVQEAMRVNDQRIA
jgi:hypothetical protein